MKKRILAIMLLFGIFIFAGCGGKSPYLKLEATTKTCSEFYSEALVSWEQQLNSETFAEADINDLDSKKEFFAYWKQLLFANNKTIRSAISAVDFCIEISNQNNGINFRVFEYVDDIVYVSVNTSGSTYTVKYFENAEGDLNEVLQTEPTKTFRFEIKSDKASGKYQFTEKNEKHAGIIEFNASMGTLVITCDGKILNNTLTQSLKVELYSYKNNVKSGRVFAVQKIGQEDEKLAFEFLTKDCYKRAKIGIVSGTEFEDLTKSSEEFIATEQDSKKDCGIKFVYSQERGVLKDEADAFGVIKQIHSFGIYPQ